MLSHIYNTAKRILSRSPSVHDRESETRDTPPTSSSKDPDDAMVTTRRGTDTPGSEATPRSNVKTRAGKRELESQETPTAAKRQRKTALGAKKSQVTDESEEAAPEPSDETSDTIDVVVPKLPIRRRGSPVVVVEQPYPVASTEGPASTQDSINETPNQASSSVYATPATKIDLEGSPTPRATRSGQKGQSSAKKKGTHIEIQQTNVEITPEIPEIQGGIPSSTLEKDSIPVPSQANPAKKAHMRFDSEEPTEPRPSIHMNAQGHKRYAVPAQETVSQIAIPDSDDSGSDSDEAPEIVSTTAATQKATAARIEARRAQEAQAEKERQKRVAREARIAQDKANKRFREEVKARKLARKAAKQGGETEEDFQATTEPSLDFKSSSLPALLPDSLLSALPDQRAPTPPLALSGPTDEQLRQQKLNRHIKFLERTDKGIKDVKKGKLSVSVLGQQNKALPPKANRDTRNVRERWLKGRTIERRGKKTRTKMAKVERKGFGNAGFLRLED